MNGVLFRSPYKADVCLGDMLCKRYFARNVRLV
jgi:hypothetical protein